MYFYSFRDNVIRSRNPRMKIKDLSVIFVLKNWNRYLGAILVLNASNLFDPVAYARIRYSGKPARVARPITTADDEGHDAN